MSYEPLHHKYRPQTFANLVGQEAISQTLTNAIVTGRIAPAYLFTGSRGTGKTSSARILAKSLNCLNSEKPTKDPCGICDLCLGITKGSALDVIEIDAASNTGVDNIREIIERAQFAPVQCRYKVYIIDEVHMLSQAAFNALLKTLEEPPSRVVFILATTDPQRVLPTIISRCQRFDFRRIPLGLMVQHLQDIAAKENIKITLDALTLVAQFAQGGLRDAESLLDQLSLLTAEVTVEQVWDLVGAVPERDLMALVEAIRANNPQLVLELCRRLMDRGREPLIVLQNLAGFYRDLLIAKTAPSRQDLVALTPPIWQQLCEFVQKLEVTSILRGCEHLKQSEVQIKNTTQPRLWLEVTMLGLLPSADLVAGDEDGNYSLIKKTTQNNRSQTGQNASVDSYVLNSAKDLPTTEPQSKSKSKLDTSKTNASEQKFSTTVSQTQPNHTANVLPPASLAHQQPPSTPAVSSSGNLEQIWQDLLAHVQMPSIQTLLHQHGKLIALDGTFAKINMRSQPLLKMVQEGLPQIEAAFEKICNRKLKVIFQVASNTNPSQNIVTKEANLKKSTSKPNAGPTIKPATQVPPNQGKRNESDTKESASTEELSKQEQSKSQSASSNPITTESESPALSPKPQEDGDRDEVEKALGILGKFFEGEVIDLTDNHNRSEASIASKESKEIEAVTQKPLLESDLIEPTSKPSEQASSANSQKPPPIPPRQWDLQYDEDGDLAF
ncbi:MAG: DNA polymerase III subunit gamma/tau [Merismopedia sp. SIO2A8]|nr:DNA polymerase III subunit gamma/tau [Symploca sp. SIO2B6]NET49958.1 DNA polymerase III subunit gamma/tau [Merismopedia sp. SIO2A8]